MEALLRAEDVARTLGVTRSTVYNLAKTGVIRSVTFKTKGDRLTIRFRPEDVRDFIEGHVSQGGKRCGGLEGEHPTRTTSA